VFILDDVHFNRIEVNPMVAAEMQRLRTTRQLRLCYTPLVYSPGPHFTIGYHNSRSLHMHMDDVAADPDMTSCSILFVSETRARPEDSIDYTLPAYPFTARNDAVHGSYTDDSGRPFHGMVSYSKAPYLLQPRHISSPGAEATVVVCEGLGGSIVAAGLYISPKMSAKAALN
jgi:hypothetical protein